MAEKGSMEGKDLALEEKRKQAFEEMILDEKNKMQNKDAITINSSIPITIKRTDKSYSVILLGIEICTITDDKAFKYNIENLESIKKAIEEKNNEGRPTGVKNFEDLGLPDIEYLKYLEKEKEKSEAEGDMAREEGKGNKELDDEEKPELEGKKEKKAENKNEQNNNQKKNLIKLNDKVFKILFPSAREYGGIYLDPDTQEIVGRNRTTHEIEPVRGFSSIKGENSSKPIHGMENREHKHVNALRMYQSDDRPTTGIVVLRDGTEKGNYDVKFTTRRAESNNIKDFAYVDIPLLASQEKIGEGRAKEISGVRQGIRGQGEQDKVQDEFDELNEEIEVPEDIINAFDEEMKRQTDGIISMKQFKDILLRIVTEKLNKEYKSQYPRDYGEEAEEIVNKMVDENKSYEEAKRETFDSGREPGGPTPDEKRDRTNA